MASDIFVNRVFLVVIGVEVDRMLCLVTEPSKTLPVVGSEVQAFNIDGVLREVCRVVRVFMLHRVVDGSAVVGHDTVLRQDINEHFCFRIETFDLPVSCHTRSLNRSVGKTTEELG